MNDCNGRSGADRTVGLGGLGRLRAGSMMAAASLRAPLYSAQSPIFQLGGISFDLLAYA